MEKSLENYLPENCSSIWSHSITLCNNNNNKDKDELKSYIEKRPTTGQFREKKILKFLSRRIPRLV